MSRRMIKTLVSKNKRRFQEDGFDLDLTYICDDIIAMGFPAEKLEGVFRNHIDDVLRFLELKHRDHYRIYNLCSERQYDEAKFHNRVAVYPFADHNPPQMELIGPFCEDVHNWLSKDKKNVVAIHCKAGKGRTGVMICSYLLHRKAVLNPEEALNYYGMKRTRDTKGVTIPSQRRYVEYYGELVSEGGTYSPVRLQLKTIRFEPMPTINGGAFSFYFVISQGKEVVFRSENIEVRRSTRFFHFDFLSPLKLTGDIKVEFKKDGFNVKKQSNLFYFWFNTRFVKPGTLVRSESNSRSGSDFGLQQDSSSSSTNSVFTSSTQSVTSSLTVSQVNQTNCEVNSTLNSSSTSNPVNSSLCEYGSGNASGGSPSAPLNGHNPNRVSTVFGLPMIRKKNPLGPADCDQGNSGSDSESGDDLVLLLTKDHLDRAHKDKNHRIFTKEFKIQMKFIKAVPSVNLPTGYESRYTHSNHHPSSVIRHRNSHQPSTNNSNSNSRRKSAVNSSRLTADVDVKEGRGRGRGGGKGNAFQGKDPEGGGFLEVASGREAVGLHSDIETETETEDTTDEEWEGPGPVSTYL